MDSHLSNIFKELCRINSDIHDNILSGEIADDESNCSPKPHNRKKHYRKKLSISMKKTIQTKKFISKQHCNFLQLFKRNPTTTHTFTVSY
jgi:hypothetical protein